MATSREQFLARLRPQSTGNSFPFAAFSARAYRFPFAAFSARAYRSPLSSVELADRFTAALERAGGRAYYAGNIEQGARALERILSESQPSRVLWAGDGIVESLVTRGDPATAFSRVPIDATTLRTLVDPNDAAVTGANFGIAETGTVVLTASAEQPRLLSALVSIHIAVLPLDRLVPTFGDLLPYIRQLTPVTSSITCITGPSRTGDIEQTITIGAHGPRQVHVILINDCSEAGPTRRGDRSEEKRDK